MASLQELRKRLRSIRSTGQLADAMRTAATAKHARLSQMRSEFRPYAEACRGMQSLLGSAGVARPETGVEPRDCVMILSGNRGLCGGFNAELFRFMDERLPELRSPLLLAAGKKAAAHLRERGAAFEEFTISDVPTYEELRPLTERALALYASGEAGRVLMICQRFRNMLVQTPELVRLLPETEEDGSPLGGNLMLYLPDRETISAQLAVKCLGARVYELALENACGAQAATMMAMRSACDNAETSADELELTINRRRQADVTSGVIETASGNQQQGG